MKEATQDLKLTIKGQEVTVPKEDYYFTDDGDTPVIKHAPLKKLAAQFGARVTRTVLEFPPVPTVDGIYVAHRAFGVDENGNEVSAVGEANPGNLEGLAADYPVIMSNKRAEDRLLIALLGLEGTVYSESEIPPTASSEPEEELKFTFGKYAGKSPKEILDTAGPEGKQYLQWFSNSFEPKNAKQRKLKEITQKLLSA